MKRPLLVLCGVIFLCTAGPIPASFAQGPRGAGSERHHDRFHFWFHRRPKTHQEKTPPLYNVPKSVGWWHHRNPGPAGVGVK
jgi:hypothetical protein